MRAIVARCALWRVNMDMLDRVVRDEVLDTLAAAGTTAGRTG
ncbi:hypothetical protein ACIBCN_01590 [Nocardia sp. NPDC051052]